MGQLRRLQCDPCRSCPLVTQHLYGAIWQSGKGLCQGTNPAVLCLEGTALEPVALKAAMVMPLLLLQKPHSTSKSKEHTCCLEIRLRSWSLGDIEGLMNEGRTIQLHLPLSRPLNHTQEQRQARAFAHLMFQGKVRAALRLVSDQCSSGVLNIDQEIDGTPVLDLLKSKHPPAQQASSATLFFCLPMTAHRRHILSSSKE